MAKPHMESVYGHKLNMEAPLSTSRRPLSTRTRSPTRRSSTSVVLVPGMSSKAEDKGTRTFMSIYQGDVVEYQGHVGERFEKNGVTSYYIDGRKVSRDEFIGHGGWLR